MEAIFAKMINMSLTGGIVIAVVLLGRLFLKRAPKIYSYLLWGVVLFRLLCPLSLTAGLSVLKLAPVPVNTTPGISSVSYRPVQQALADRGFVPAAEAVSQQPVDLQEPEQAEPPVSALEIASCIWLAGAAVMAGYSVIQYLILRRRLVGATVYRGEVYLADYIDSPFVMGILRPRVYLPSSIPMEERRFIIAHERHHIHRCDPLWKLLGYIALCIHWFNPLVWLAFVLAGKDMEMSCDEAVIKRLGEEIRADYSQALLRLATHKKIISGMPLAFGEGDTRGRVLNMARWKQPRVWVSILCVIACLVTLAACALNPKQEEKPLEEMTRITGPASIGAWELYFTLPEGCTEEMQEKGDSHWRDSREGCVIIMTDGTDTIGGVMAFPIPENFSADNWDWFHNLDLPEWKDETLGYSAGGAPGSEVSVEFFSDVPPGEERAVQNLHNLYFWDGWIYDLWFDELKIKPEVMEAILDSISVGEEKEIPVADMPYKILEMPAGGYDYRTEADSSITFRKGDSIVGGIVAYAIPEGVYDANDDIFLWLEDVGIPDFEDTSLVYMGGISDFTGGWSAEFASDVPEGVEPTVKRCHHFNVVGDTVYDFWLDQIQLDQSTQFAFADAVLFAPPVSEVELERTGRQLQTELTFYVEGMEETCPATLYIGEGYSIYIPDGEWTHYTGNLDYQPVQTWQSHANPEAELQIVTLNGMTLPQAQAWVKEEFSEYALIQDNQGGLGGTDAENHMADVSFCAAEDAVYAICRLYPLEAAEGFGTRLYVIADTFALTETAPEQTMTAEDAAFAKCFAVMDAVQNGSYQISQVQVNAGNEGPRGYARQFYASNGDWLMISEMVLEGINITDAGEYKNRQAWLYANDRFFTNEGNWSSEELVWTEKEPDYEGNGPWLDSFYFVKHYVTYMDTLTNEAGESYQFRVDAPFEDREDATSYYFVSFDFDSEGNFLSVYLQINPAQDNAYTLTESILSLDEQEITAEINREYQRAIR